MACSKCFVTSFSLWIVNTFIVEMKVKNSFPKQDNNFSSQKIQSDILINLLTVNNKTFTHCSGKYLCEVSQLHMCKKLSDIFNFMEVWLIYESLTLTISGYGKMSDSLYFYLNFILKCYMFSIVLKANCSIIAGHWILKEEEITAMGLITNANFSLWYKFSAFVFLYFSRRIHMEDTTGKYL